MDGIIIQRGDTLSVHLSVRSHYSLLNGLMSIEDIILTAKAYGFQQIALTEYRVMFSHLEFYELSKKHHIKPIFGLEVDLEEGTLVLLAKDNRGHQVLSRLSYILSQKDYIYYDDFNKYLDHLVVIVPSENGPFEALLIREDYARLEKEILSLKEVIPDFYIGISHHESNFFTKRNYRLSEIGENLGIESLTLPKVYYKDENDHASFRALRAIDEGKLLNDPSLNYAPGRHFYSREELKRIYDDKWNQVALKVADMCKVSFEQFHTNLPEFDNERNVSNDVFLRTLAEFGLKKRLNNQIPFHYQKRLDYELDILISMDFTNYFLIVYDVIRFAKLKGINVGPGRGSSAGSLVAYSLGITEVDPLKYDLLFERFLNPERATMPDIDIDFPDDKRDLVVNYVVEKYGANHVAHIVAFGTLRARQSFRDSARILNVPNYKVDQVSKLIRPGSLQESLKENKRLRLMIENDQALKECYDLAVKIEGTPRHVTQHAAGIVMSAKPLLEVSPLYRIDDQTHVIQYDMTYIEDIGLIKMDFLGIRNLSIIDRIARKIGNGFEINTISYADRKTFDLISKGHTTGIFQLESDGMRSLLKQMRPNRFEDIVDAIALYRPGPMENIPVYLKNRKNPKRIEFLHEDLKSITESTNGILIYQEQIMQVAQVFAGFSLSRADILRRAMSQKDSMVLKSMEVEFIEGALALGYDKELAVKIFNLIYKFANYGFNKSHSVAYSMVSYQLSYLKANYPAVFYTELLTSVIGDERKTKLYMDECRRLDVSIKGPNLNLSTYQYELINDEIIFPLTIIKGISKRTTEMIMEERNKNGSYHSFYRTIVRLKAHGLKKNHFERMIDAGVFDQFNQNRLSMRASLDEALQYADIITIKDSRNQISFDYDLVSEPVFTKVPVNRKEILAREFQVLGFYLSDYPTVEYKNKYGTDGIAAISPSSKSYRVIVKVDRIKTHRAKNGRMMAFLSLSDDSGVIDGVVFPNLYPQIEDKLAVNDIILIKGNMREEGSVLINNIHIFSQ